MKATDLRAKSVEELNAESVSYTHLPAHKKVVVMLLILLTSHTHKKERVMRVQG